MHKPVVTSSLTPRPARADIAAALKSRPLARGSAPRIDSSVELVPGRMLGRYELVATIGKGGMATAMLARLRGAAGFEKLVVVKAVQRWLAPHPSAAKMLRDEAQIGARIDHPNVVSVYELGEVDGTYFIAMEYLAGETLAYILRSCRQARTNLHPVLAARIVMEAAEGLHAAHELDIIHRDISPDNVVVLYNGGVKLVDFGIAKCDGRITQTQHGLIKGKCAYMSPEQLSDGRLDRRSDVFALGIVLWETLTQRKLFHAPDMMTTASLIISAPRVPPSQLRRLVPRSLDAVVLKALEPDRHRRYQSAAELRGAIDDAIWQHRCDAKHVRSYMAASFPDRIAERQHLIRHDEPAETSIATAVLPGQLALSRRRLETRRWLRAAVWLGLAIAIAVTLAIVIGISDVGHR